LRSKIAGVQSPFLFQALLLPAQQTIGKQAELAAFLRHGTVVHLPFGSLIVIAELINNLNAFSTELSKRSRDTVVVNNHHDFLCQQQP
jgi:hypothetical protein